MLRERSKLATMGRLGALLTAALGVPAIAMLKLPAFRDRPVFAVVVILAWELVLTLIMFMGDVWSDLRKRWVPRFAEMVDSWLLRRTSRFTARYLRYIEASTRYLDAKGLATQGEYTLEMNEVLVRLSLEPTPLHSLSADPVRPRPLNGEMLHARDIWYWIRRAQNDKAILTIIGPPGSGKTTLVRSVAFVLAHGGGNARKVDAPRKLPVIVNLRDCSNFTFEKNESFASLIRLALAGFSLHEPPEWVESHLRRGNFLILLDGLDEIPDFDDRRRVSAWIEHQASSHENNLLVVTSRPFGYRDNPIVGAMVVEVDPLAEDQVSSFIGRWYSAISARSYGTPNLSSQLAAQNGAADLLARLAEDPALMALTVNPLLLTMVANVHHYRGALPGSRAELYQEICEVFLGKRSQAKGITLDLPHRQKQVVLRELAYRMMCANLTDIKLNQALYWMRTPLSRLSETLSVEDFLDSIEATSGLLVEKERNLYAFSHLTFQDYLAAEFIRENACVNELLTNLESVWWRETIRLYAAIADTTPIVDACLDRAANPDLLVLAAQCAEDGREIRLETRKRLNRFISPPNAREDEAARRSAARVRLVLRQGRDRALGRGALVADSPVTWLEYQSFLDSANANDCRIPDHWTSNVYPARADNDPVVGIRYDDAKAFCDWIESNTESPTSYRLPRVEELEAPVSQTLRDSSSLNLRYWTLTHIKSYRDVGFTQLLRDPASGEHYDTYPERDRPAAEHDASASYLERLIDQDVPSSRMSDQAASGIFDRLGLPIYQESMPRELELVQNTWRNTRSLDIGQLTKRIILASELTHQYLHLEIKNVRQGHSGLDYALERLKTLSLNLREFSLDTFDRACYPDRLTEQSKYARKLMRRSAVEAVRAAIIVYEVVTPKGFNLQEPGWLPKPTYRIPNPSLRADVILNALAHAYAGIYADLVLWEARIDGDCPPVESIAYVREPSASSLPLTDDNADRAKGVWAKLKPTLDRTAAAAGLIILAPVLLAIALVIKLQDGGPVFYRSARLGRAGEPFTLINFRSMVVDAESRKLELLSVNEGHGALFKLSSDPRVSRFGHFLRRFRLNELPQLFNILGGQMSFVGPRPLMAAEIAQYPSSIAIRFRVRPGLIGPTLIAGGSDLDGQDLLQLENIYVQHSSFVLDFQTLVRSIVAILRGYDAY